MLIVHTEIVLCLLNDRFIKLSESKMVFELISVAISDDPGLLRYGVQFFL